jgi:acyl-coenzyme A thioesterase PaaI-like protein
MFLPATRDKWPHPTGFEPAGWGVFGEIDILDKTFLRRRFVATKDEIIKFLQSEFPQSASVVEEVGNRHSRVRRKINIPDLRPGGTVSGPVMFEVADVALYVALLGEIGLVPLAVTTHINIDFLRKPSSEHDLIGECRLLKVGRTLAVGDVSIYSDGNPDAVAHATGVYFIPPK